MLVAICGKAGAGKDTIGDHLVREYGFYQDSLAAPIKRLVEDVFVLDSDTVYDRELREQPLEKWKGWTVRRLLQFIGTELFRKNIREDIWVRSLCYRIQGSGRNCVVTDVRFPNEKEILEEEFGDECIIIKVVRPSEQDGSVGIPGHESEAYDLDSDYVLVNDGTVQDLKLKVDELMAQKGMKPLGLLIGRELKR